MNKALLLACSLLLTLAACKKDDEPSSPQSLLRAGTWSRTSARATHRDPVSQRDTTIDYSLGLPDCVKDNTFTFGEGYSGTMHLGSNKCNAGDPDDRPFTWEITDNGTRIGIYNTREFFQTPGGDLNNAQILYLTSANLTIRYSVYTTVTTTLPLVSDTVIYTDVFKKN